MSRRIWLRRDETSGIQYVVSTLRAHLDLDFINNAFAGETMSWATAMSPDQMQKLLENSLTLGLYIYKAPSNTDNITLTEEIAASLPRDQLQQIGMARWVTDQVTFAWLADVLVLPEYQGKGLGGWQVGCCREMLDEMKAAGGFRRALVMTDNATKGPAFYEKYMGAVVYDQSGERKLLSTVRE